MAINTTGKLLSGIPWSIPIPLRDYSFIAMSRRKRGRSEQGKRSGVKNHTFFACSGYSLRGMVNFLSIYGVNIH
ncbi:MAG TPA: hypothetical protein DCY50_03935 [Franconibacter helveticus]|nr:hypothetical protein [Franconibacter helveticus]